jgi:dynein heavy chain
VREYEIFHRLLKIPFFARYRTWKSLFYWKKVILRSKINLAKKNLEKSLFLNHATLRPALFKVQTSCRELFMNSRFFKLEELKSFDLSQFLTDQEARVDFVSVVQLQQWEVDVRAIVEGAAISCLNESGFPVESNLDELNTSAAPKKLSYTDQATRRSECRRLQRFVKLVDYLMVNSLHMLVIETVRDLLQSVFQGCANSDVAIDESGNGLLLHEIIEIGGDKMKISSDVNDFNTDAKIIVGGAAVGESVGTDELIQCGFDGFLQILTRIIRQTATNMINFDEEAEVESPIKYENSRNRTSKHLLIEDEEPFKPLFRTEFLVNLTDSKEFYFSPSLPEFLTTVDVLLKRYIKVLESFNLLTNSFPFLDPANLSGGSYSSTRGLEDSESTEGPQLGSIALEGGYYREICGRIRGVLVGMFSNAFTWMKSWEKIRSMWIQGDKFDALQSLTLHAGPIASLLAVAVVTPERGLGAILQEYKDEQDRLQLERNPEFQPTAQGVLEIASTVIISLNEDGEEQSKSPLVEFFEDYLKKFTAEKQAMESIPVCYTINNLLIDSSKLKSVLLPIPERCLSDVSTLLPKVAREKNGLLLNEVQTWLLLLNSQPASVDAFVDYLEWLDKSNIYD